MASHSEQRCVNLRHRWKDNVPLGQNCEEKKTTTQQTNTLCYCNTFLDKVNETPGNWDTCTKWSTEWERWILCTSRGCCLLFRSTKSTFPEAVPTAAWCAIGQQATHVTWTDTGQIWVSVIQAWGDLSAERWTSHRCEETGSQVGDHVWTRAALLQSPSLTTTSRNTVIPWKGANFTCGFGATKMFYHTNILLSVGKSSCHQLPTADVQDF